MNAPWNAPISDRFSSLCARVFSPAAAILESEKTLGTRLGCYARQSLLVPSPSWPGMYPSTSKRITTLHRSSCSAVLTWNYYFFLKPKYKFFDCNCHPMSNFSCLVLFFVNTVKPLLTGPSQVMSTQRRFPPKYDENSF